TLLSCAAPTMPIQGLSAHPPLTAWRDPSEIIPACSAHQRPRTQMKRSVAIRRCHRVHATNFEARGEFHHPVALAEHSRPPDGGLSIPIVRHGMNQTRWLDKCISLCHLLRVALLRLWIIMPLSQCAAFQDDVAGCLVEVPRNSVAGFHREYVNLHCGRDWVAVTEVIYGATQGQRNVGQRKGRGAEYGHKADGYGR